MPEDIGLSSLYKSITYLIQLNAQIASSIYTYASHLRRVPPDILTLLDELRALEKTLTMILQLRNLLSSPSVTSTIQSRLQQLNDLNRKTNECLQGLASRLKPTKSARFASVLGGTKWLPNMKEAPYHTSNIQKQRKFYLPIIIFDKESRSNSDSTEDILPRTPSGNTLGLLQAESPILEPSNKEITPDTGEDENLKQVFSWLRHGDYQRHLDIRQQRIAKTGIWILRDIRFQKWREQRDFRLVWGHGLAGAGKTFLSSIVIDHLQSQAYAKNFGIAYIYFSYQDQEQQDPIYVLASLIEQLFRQHPSLSRKIEITNNLNKLNIKGRKPSINELYNILLEASRDFDRTFLVFDALDECYPSQRRFLLPLFKRMGEDCFGVFLTSRPYEDIRDSLHLTMKIEISANREDIGMYIQQRIEEDPRAKLLLRQGNFRDEIITHLVNGSKGVFLWARLQLMHICKQTSTEKILFTLEKIRDEKSSTPERFLDQSYDRAMMNIYNQRKSSVNLAAKIFSWLARTRRTLTLDELRIAVSVKPNTYRLNESDLPDRAKLLEVCDSLVTIGEYSNTVRLTHYTVLEYLLRNPILTSSGDPAYELALTCATYLSFDTFHPRVSFKEGQELCPFFKYSACYLSSHLKSYDDIASTDASAILSLAILKFLMNSRNVTAYLKLLYTQKGLYDSRGSKRTFWNSKRGEYLRLHVASSIGNLSVVQLLLEGANLTIKNNGWKVLCLAKKNLENESVARLLIKEDDKDIFEKDDLGQTALHIAASEGHTDIVQLLLDKGLDPLAPDKEGKTALHGAAFAGHESVIRTLLEYKGNLLALDINRNAALCWAVSRGYHDIAKDIIENTSATVGDEEWILVPSFAEGNEASVGELPWNHTDAQINIHHEPIIERCRTLALIPYVGNVMPTNLEPNHWPPRRWDDPECSLSPSFVSSCSTQSCSTPRAPTQTSNNVNLYYTNDGEEFFITEEEEDSCSNSSDRSSGWDIVHYTNGNNDKGKRKAVDSQANAPKQESTPLGISSTGLDDALGRKRRRKDGGSAPTVTTNLNGINDSPRLYACPYYKNNAQAHPRCAGWSAPEVHRVKEHCRRVHIKPLQCQRCGNFRAGDQGQINAHSRFSDCVKNWEVIPVGSEDIAKAKALETRNLVWRRIYVILFPDCENNVPSPYWDDPITAVTPATSGTSGIATSQPIQIFEFILWLGRNTDIQSYYDRFLEEARQSQPQANQGIGVSDDNELFGFESFTETSSRNASSQMQEENPFSSHNVIQTYTVEAGNSQEEATTNTGRGGREVNVPRYNGYRTTETFSIDTPDNQEETTADTTQSGSEPYQYNGESWDLGSAGAQLPWPKPNWMG